MTRYVVFKLGCIPGALVGVVIGLALDLAKWPMFALAALGAAITGVLTERLILQNRSRSPD